jgi:hypothetical protein
MRASLIVVRTIRGQDLPQMLRAEDKNVTPNSRAEAFQSVVQHMHSATAISVILDDHEYPLSEADA